VGIFGLALGIAAGQGAYQQRYNQSSGSLVLDTVALPPPGVQAPNPWRAKDPYRQIGDVIWTVTGPDDKNGWVEFSGRVWNVQPNGVCIKGVYTGSGFGADDEGIDFYVANFPYEVADDEILGRSSRTMTFYLAKEAGTYTYPTAAGGTKTLRKLDYGAIYVPPPPTPEQIEAAQRAAAAAKEKVASVAKAGANRALEMNEAAAATNDVYGLMRMGERYRDGDGVEKDPAKAKDYLQRAAAAGSPTAEADLKKLTESSQ
jgi:hypothetical protein